MAGIDPIQTGITGSTNYLRQTAALSRLLPNGQAEQQEALSDLDIKKQKLRTASRDFEAIFIRQLMSTMEQSLEGGLFGKGTEGDIYSDFLNSAIADRVADRNELGLADAIYRRMVVQLEGQEK